MKKVLVGLMLTIPWMAAVVATGAWAVHDEKLMAALKATTSIYVVVIYTISLGALLLFFGILANAGWRIILGKGGRKRADN